MKNSEEITSLAYEILVDLSENRVPIHCTLLKASRLAMITNDSKNRSVFQEMSKYAETATFLVETFQSSVDAARDPNISLSSANPNQYLRNWGNSNAIERSALRKSAIERASSIAGYRSSTYEYSMNIYQKYRLGNTAETIFEKKRERTDPILTTIFPDINDRLNTIDSNIKSTRQEDWKNAVSSCRTLLMDLADILNPSTKELTNKTKYINRLKDFVSTKEDSDSRKKYLGNYIEELKERIQDTVDLTQGPSHQVRPSLESAEDIVLMTYLLISDLLVIYTYDKDIKSQDKKKS